jgi:predicted metal-binding membrane protein
VCIDNAGLKADVTMRLMLMQMVLGVMNLAVMAGVAVIIATEKVWKRGPILARLVGAMSIVVGIVFVVRSV